MRDRLIGLCDRKIEEMHFVNSDHWFDFSQKINEIVDYLLENGVVVIDADVVSPENRPLISQYMGRPIDEVINLIRRSEWISVEDRLPEECKAVLCFAGNKTVLAFMEKTEDCGKYVPVFWDLVAYNRDDTWDEVCVTHWMPLPEAPKMKGGGV